MEAGSWTKDRRVVDRQGAHVAFMVATPQMLSKEDWKAVSSGSKASNCLEAYVAWESTVINRASLHVGALDLQLQNSVETCMSVFGELQVNACKHVLHDEVQASSNITKSAHVCVHVHTCAYMCTRVLT